MKYFIDTEFHEYFVKQSTGLFSSRQVHTIDLISIGIMADDGRQYYAVSKEFDIKAAWENEWLRKNVLHPIYKELYNNENQFTRTYHTGIAPFSLKAIKNLIAFQGKTNAKIAEEIIEFVNPGITDFIYTFTRHDSWMEQYYPKEFAYIRSHNTKIPETYYKSGFNGDGYKKNANLIYNQPEFYGYYADYDWVVLCSIFGTMMNLPKGFPQYCRDLKQMIDEVAENDFAVLDTHEKRLEVIKKHPNYPKQENEHSAIHDAMWNYQLYHFLKQL